MPPASDVRDEPREPPLPASTVIGIVALEAAIIVLLWILGRIYL